MTRKQAYNEGRKAFGCGNKYNPYPHEHPAHNDWNRGYEAAEAEYNSESDPQDELTLLDAVRKVRR